MRILLQHPHKPEEISGVVTFVEASARALEALGHEVRILSTAQLSREEIMEAARWADVIHLNSTHPVLTIASRLQGKRLINSFHFPFWGTWKTSPEDRALGFTGCFLKTVAVFWGHGKGWRYTPKFVSYFTTSVVRMFVRLVCTMLAHHRIAPTRFIADDAALPLKVEVVPYPYDTKDMAELRTAHPARDSRFCYVGRITPEKGPDLILEAANLLQQRGLNVSVCLVGDGAQLSSLRGRATELNLGERFHAPGKLPRLEALRHMAGSLAVVVPSRWDDPSPFTVLEACALGRPVIGSNRGGIPEITGPGLVFNPDNAVELADHMEKLVRQPAEAERIGADCLAFVRERSDPVHVAQSLLRLYGCNGVTPRE
jgi:glycosyltransferase involved in cell wall biosynthesis